MEYNNDAYDFVKNVEILDKHRDPNDDIKIDLDYNEFDKSAGKKEDWSFMNTNNNQGSNASTRPDSISNTNNNVNLNNEVRREQNTMIDISGGNENVKEVQVVQVKSADYMSKVYYKPGNTLHEPIKETFKRDLNRIYEKIKYVLKLNKSEEEEMRAILDWDLWGPLLLCILLSR